MGSVEVVQVFPFAEFGFEIDLGFVWGHRAGGRLPLNTNGGGLSYAHPATYGLFAIIEAASQLRRQAANQIAG